MATTLWNKLGNAGEVGASEIGVNGVIDGAVTYAAGKFDDGAFSNNAANRIRFNFNSATVIGSWTDFVAQMWIKPVGFNIVNGVPDDGGSYYFFSFYQDANNRVRWGFEQGIHKLTMDAKIGGVNYIHRGIQFNANAGVLKLLTVVVNNSGIDGGADKFRVYESDASTDTLIYNSVANGYNTWNTTQDLVLLVQKTVGPVFVTPFCSVLDNLKIDDDSDTFQAYLDGKNVEGFFTGAHRLIDGGIRSPLIDSSLIT